MSLLILFLFGIIFLYENGLADTEKDLTLMAKYLQVEKLEVYGPIKLGESFDDLSLKLRASKVKLTKSCNRKLTKLCLYVINESNTLNVSDGVLTFYDSVLIKTSLHVRVPPKSRLTTFDYILKNIIKPIQIVYKADGIKGIENRTGSTVNLCNIGSEDNPRLIKIFQSLQWEHDYGKVVYTSPHRRDFISNKSTMDDCKTAIGDILGIYSFFTLSLEEKFSSLIMEI